MVWPALAIPTGGKTYVTTGTKLNPAVGAEDTTMFNESTTYNALNVALRGSGRAYRLGISYTWSKSLDESSSSNGGTNFSNSLIAPFPNYIGRFKGPSDFNVAQNAVVNGLYSPRGLNTRNEFLKAASTGYQLGGIVRVATGLPFTPLISGDPLGLSSANTFQFPNRVYSAPGCSGNPTDMSHKNDYQFLNRNCFAYPLPTPGPNGTYFPRFGNLARNSIFGPGITTLDISAVKNTAVPKFGELARIEFRAEAFNVLNHPNFSVPARANSVVYKASTNPAVAGADLQPATTHHHLNHRAPDSIWLEARLLALQAPTAPASAILPRPPAFSRRFGLGRGGEILNATGSPACPNRPSSAAETRESPGPASGPHHCTQTAGTPSLLVAPASPAAG